MIKAPGWQLALPGMELADSAEPDEWKDRADAAIHYLAGLGKEFTAEDVRAMAGDPEHQNAFGARMGAASRSGLIVKVGYRTPARATRHCNPLAVWRGT